MEKDAGKTGIEMAELCFGALPFGPLQKHPWKRRQQLMQSAGRRVSSVIRRKSSVLRTGRLALKRRKTSGDRFKIAVRYL